MLEPAAAATDWGLAAVAAAGIVGLLAARPRRDLLFWLLALLALSASASLGAVYHGWLKTSAAWSGPLWAAVTWCLAAMLTFMLAGTSRAAADPRNASRWAAIQVGSLSVFTIAIVLGWASISTLLWLESVAMAGIVLLWLRGYRRKLPGSRAMMLAIGLSGAAALFRLLPIEFRLGWSWDPESLYHIAQVPGIIAFIVAIHRVTGMAQPAISRPERFGERLRQRLPAWRLRPWQHHGAEEHW